MNLNKLRGRMVELDVNVEALADAIGNDRSTLYRKLGNFEKLTIGDAVKIKEFLKISDHDAIEIFLS